jgi:3D (Asp-Asp-Asp) domain-containing protein
MNHRMNQIRFWICFAAVFTPFIDSFAKPVTNSNCIPDVYVTGYYCVYNSELDGRGIITKTISDIPYNLKASFLFGGRGVAMQGSGRTGPNGEYIKYTGGGGYFIRLTGPNAGKNLDGQWIENPDIVRARYAHIGITDFNGFGNLALRYPDKARYSRTASFTGLTGRPLTAWRSLSIDPEFIPLGQKVEVRFKKGDAINSKFVAEDTGSAIKGKHIEIYLGEGEKALEKWIQTGSNRYANIYLTANSLPD